MFAFKLFYVFRKENLIDLVYSKYNWRRVTFAYLFFLFVFFLPREESRVVLIPFPKIMEVNPLSKQILYEAELQESSKEASSSVGILISIATKLAEKCELIPSVVNDVERMMGENTYHRILRSYSMLMFFALKVRSLCLTYLQILSYEV